MDEKHHDLSITGDKGGSRALVYRNPNLQRGFKATAKPGRHVTGVYATNSAGEALPPMYKFDSEAKIQSNFCVKLSWLKRLPFVQGRFGCPERVKKSSFYSVTSRCSMGDSLFDDYIERVILPLYPNISKNAMFDPLTGVQRQQQRQGEAQQQEGAEQDEVGNNDADDETPAVEDGLVSGAGAAMNNSKGSALAMSFEDLRVVVDGKAGDDMELRPFSKHYTKAKIIKSWEKVGFVPFTRSCIKNRKVRHELGQRDRDGMLEKLNELYEALIVKVAACEMNTRVFDAVIPIAKPVERESDEDEQVRQYVSTKGSFSASRPWAICSTRIGNSKVILRAPQREQISKDAEKVALQVQNKSQKRVQQLANTQQALLRLENAGNIAMRDKDWVDIIRWALPASTAVARL